MSPRRFASAGALLLLAAWLPSCGERGEETPGGKVRVFAAIPPLAYFAERVGDGHVQVDVLVAPGQNPHVYEPTPRQIAALAGAQVYFKMGMPFERALAGRIAETSKKLKIVEVCQGIALRRMTESEADHDGDEKPNGHGHEVGTLDPHAWLNPRYARIMAATIERALAETDPAHAGEYAKNLQALQADLDAVDAKLERVLAPLKGKELMVFHPAFGYLADAYGLRQVSVEIEGKEPSAKQLAALIERAKKDGVRVIFVQPQFSRKSAEAVAAAIGDARHPGAVIPLDDLAHDYLANLEDMAAKIEKALASEK